LIKGINSMKSNGDISSDEVNGKSYIQANHKAVMPNGTPDTDMIKKLKKEFTSELQNINRWWTKNTVDETCGGFFGEVSARGNVVKNASKGVVLNTRILWYFSEVAIVIADDNSRTMADRAYHYLLDFFDDKDKGGMVWELDHTGKVLDAKKQTYAQSFSIYALSSYYKLTGNKEAIDKALEYFELLEKHTLDTEQGGYLEAFSQDWQEIEDMRLSEKDANFPKTMNTHLHVLEAYSNLQKIYPTEAVANALKRLVNYFQGSIVDHASYHLRLFMCRHWGDHSKAYSYGHDIECSWLLHKSIKALKDEKLTAKILPTVVNLAQTCLAEGIGKHGQVLDEIDHKSGKVHEESCWWIQAEALVGFLNAYTITSDKRYFDTAVNIWKFIKAHHIDHEQGEWHWLATIDQKADYNIYKAGFWKGPYHNGRALMEGLKLLDKIKL